MIKFDNISLSFQGKVIFNDFNATVQKGKCFSISGESGRGKSTLLKLVQGYVSPDNGKILIDEEEINHKTIHSLRKKMAWIPQNINLPVNNGEDLIDLLSISEQRDKVQAFLGKLDLDSDILKKDFSKISGGQNQRIVISAVLSLNRPIVLMDEPTSSLDEKSIKRLVDVIDVLEGTTILAASHNKTWLDHSDKVIEL